MGVYFDRYKIYYDNLEKSTKPSAQKLNTEVKNSTNIISSFFEQVDNSKWLEIGKDSFRSVTNSLKNNIQKLNNFLENNLLAASTTADSLYLKVKEIKNKEIELENLKSALQTYEHDLASARRDLSALDDDDPDDASAIRRLESNISSLKHTIEITKLDIKNTTEYLIKCCKEANEYILQILELDGGDILSIQQTMSLLSEGLEMPVEGLKVVSVEFFEGDRKTFGNYLIVTLNNGRQFPVFQQVNGYWGSIRLRKRDGSDGEKKNFGGGCSIFALTSALAYLLNKPTLQVRDVAATGGQFYGVEQALGGKKEIFIDGSYYKLESDLSEKKNYGWGTDKEVVVEDIETTLRNGGVVILNISARREPLRETIDGRTRIKMSTEAIKQQTGITSTGGHVITMIGLDENDKIIFADSVYSQGRDTYTDKGLTVEEWYEIYGGKSPTHVKGRYYYTVTHAEMHEVNEQ